MQKKEETNSNTSKEESEEKEINDENFFKSKFSKINAVLIERKTENKDNEVSISYDLTNLQRLEIKTEEEKFDIEKLINNILLSSNFSFLIYAFNKIFGYLRSLFFYNLFYFIGIKFIYKIINSKSKEENMGPKAALWKRLLLFNLPELILIFYYRRKRLTKINTAIYSLFTYLNERISFVFNTDDTKNYLCQVDQNNYNIYLIQKNEKNLENINIVYMNNPEMLKQDTFFDSVIAYPNANFEDFDFNNLNEEEEKMYQDIFTFINEVEKKLKEEFSLYNTIGTICSNVSFNNSCNYNVRNALGLKILSFAILEIYLNSIKKRKKRNELFEEKEREFNEKSMPKGYFLAVNEYVILLFRIKEKYKNFDESYNTLRKKSQKLLGNYFDKVNKII